MGASFGQPAKSYVHQLGSDTECVQDNLGVIETRDKWQKR